MRKTYTSFALPLLSLLALSSCSNDDNFTEQIDPDNTIVVADSAPSAVVSAQGFYVANEDWFGHDNGSVNYFKNGGSIIYRAYRAANNGEKTWSNHTVCHYLRKQCLPNIQAKKTDWL